jgi:hypothetical protein
VCEVYIVPATDAEKLPESQTQLEAYFAKSAVAATTSDATDLDAYDDDDNERDDDDDDDNCGTTVTPVGRATVSAGEQCPICACALAGRSLLEASAHVDRCLATGARKRRTSAEEDDDNDDDGGGGGVKRRSVTPTLIDMFARKTKKS